MTRTRKWLRGVGVAAGALLVAVALALAWVLYTPAGLRFALNRGVALLPGGLAYASANGTLAGTTTINGLRYQTADGTRIEVAHASVALRPWALLARRLRIAKARIEGVTIDLARSAQPAGKSTPWSLRPPLTLVLNDARVAGLVVKRGGQSTFAASRLAIAGTWSARRIVVRQLVLNAAQGSIELQGTLPIAKGRAGHGTATIDWTQAGTHYAGKLTAHSDGKTAHLHAALSAPAQLAADLSLRPDAAHAWTLALDAPRFEARALPTLPTLLHTLALDLRGAGDAHGGTLRGKLTVNGTPLLLDPARFAYASGTLTLDPLRLRSPGIPGTAKVTGTLQLDARPMALALAIDWAGVELPARLAGQALDTHGKLRVGGTLDHYALQGALALGPPGRAADLTLDVAGTPRTLDIHALQLVQKNGGLSASGQVDFAAPLTWKLAVTARRFDPGALLAGWNGTLDFRLATQGSLTRQGPDAKLQLGHASGTLRGRNVAGSRADLRTRPGNLLEGSAVLVAGASRIEATGKRGVRTDAGVTLDIASLGDWLPNAAGSLHGRFHLKGAWPRLAVTGDLSGRALRVGASHLDGLELALSLPDLARPGGSLRLTLRGAQAAGLDFAQIELDGRGTEAAHRLQLTADGPRLDAALTVTGGWRADTGRWSGTLSHLELTPHGLPTWHQQQPAAIHWQHGAFALAEVCLGAGTARACVAATRDARGTLATDYRVQALPLTLLAALAPLDQSLAAQGEIAGSGQFTRTAAGALNGSGTLRVGTGWIAFANHPDRPLLAWSQLDLDASARGATQRLRVTGALGAGGDIHGDVSLSGPQHALTGTLDANIRRLAFLEALSPELANVKGSLTGSLALSGTLGSPRFQGRLDTQDFSAELPRAGLQLHDGRFSITGDSDGRLALTGQLTSGAGALHFDGHAGLAADSALDLKIQGENVLVADIPAAHVIASPDLAITRTGGTFHITGKVTIPTARIQVEKLPGQGPAQASPDVVIVDAPPPETVAPLALEAALEVQLGDAVKVQGYGLDGSVHGQLAVRVAPGRTATGRGEIRVAGKYQAYGQNLTIQQGRLLFAGTRLDNPGLDIRAVREIRSQSVAVGLSIRGTAQQPVLTVFPTPPWNRPKRFPISSPGGRSTNSKVARAIRSTPRRRRWAAWRATASPSPSARASASRPESPAAKRLVDRHSPPGNTCRPACS